MKKSIFIIFLALSFVITFNAYSNSKISYGLKGGFISSTVTDLSAEDYETISRVNQPFAGIFGEYPLNENTSLTVEFLYSRKGFKDEISYSMNNIYYIGDSFTYSENDELKLDYLEIPVLAKYKIANSLYITGGPYIAMLLSAKSSYSYTSTYTYAGYEFSDSDEGEEDVKENVSSTDFGFIAGIEGMMGNFIFGARYSMGLTNAFPYAADEKSHKISSFSFYIGMLFK